MKHVAATLGTVLSLITFACAGAAPDGSEPGAAEESLGEKAPSAEIVDGVGERAPSAELIDHVAEAPTSLGVSFVPAQDCEGLAGTWRGQVYSPPHEGYYEFTAHVAQPRAGAPELSGSIVARSWQGTEDDVVPPESCDTGYHWTVVEDAAGQLHEDGSVSFGGKSWRIGEHFCGDKVTNYSPDRLELVPPGGDGTHVTKLTGVVSDLAVWTAGMPIELTHVACE